MIRAVFLYILAICGMLAASLLPAHAGRVVADLSQSNVSITSGFHGTELLLFGAVIGAQFGTRAGALLRGEQLRGLLALMVLAVCLKLGFDLAMQPSDLFSVELLK